MSQQFKELLAGRLASAEQEGVLADSNMTCDPEGDALLAARDWCLGRDIVLADDLTMAFVNEDTGRCAWLIIFMILRPSQ